MQRTGANHLTTSPQRIMTGTNPRNRSRWASQGSLTLSKSMGLTTSGDLQSLPNDSYMRVESTDSGFVSPAFHWYGQLLCCSLCSTPYCEQYQRFRRLRGICTCTLRKMVLVVHCNGGFFIFDSFSLLMVLPSCC